MAVRYKFVLTQGLRAAILAIAPTATISRSSDGYLGVLVPTASVATFEANLPASPVEVTGGLGDSDGTGLIDIGAASTWTDLLMEGTWINPGSNKIGQAPAYSAGEWSLSLLGGAGTNVSDPLSGAHLIGPPLTTCADGSPLDATDLWSILLALTETNAPALASDIVIAAGFVNEDVDSGTIDGVWIGINYTGSSRTAVRGVLSNGGNAQASSAPSTSIRSFVAPISKHGNDSAASWDSQARGRGILDGSGGCLGSTVAAATGDLQVAAGSALPRPFLAAWRTTTTDTTTRGLAFKARRGPIVGMVLP